MNKITNSDWAVDASTITDSNKFKDVALRVCENDGRWVLERSKSFFLIKESKWYYSWRNEDIMNDKKIITYTDFLTMFDKPKTNNMETPIGQLIELFKASDIVTYSKADVIERLEMWLPLEKLKLDMAELKGEIKATIKNNTPKD